MFGHVDDKAELLKRLSITSYHSLSTLIATKGLITFNFHAVSASYRPIYVNLIYLSPDVALLELRPFLIGAFLLRHWVWDCFAFPLNPASYAYDRQWRGDHIMCRFLLFPRNAANTFLADKCSTKHVI